jgi:hypothetical protein
MLWNVINFEEYAKFFMGNFKVYGFGMCLPVSIETVFISLYPLKIYNFIWNFPRSVKYLT